MLGYNKISDQMKDIDFVRLVKLIGYGEGLPVVVNPGIINPRTFIDNVIYMRLPNPFMPDTPQRIASDTSQKLSIRFGETIKAYLRNPSLDVKDLRAISLVLAGWCRYLLGVDDNGDEFELNPDPMLDKLQKHFAGVKPDFDQVKREKEEVHSLLLPILSDSSIFGVNLYDVGLGNRIESLFIKLASGKGAVRRVLKGI
jgi:fructuronate reductase